MREGKRGAKAILGSEMDARLSAATLLRFCTDFASTREERERERICHTEQEGEREKEG